jgi:hypothetical protein
VFLVSKHLSCKIGPCGAEAVTISKHENHGEALIDLAEEISGYASSRSLTGNAYKVGLTSWARDSPKEKRGEVALIRPPTLTVNLKQKRTATQHNAPIKSTLPFGGLNVV